MILVSCLFWLYLSRHYILRTCTTDSEQPYSIFIKPIVIFHISKARRLKKKFCTILKIAVYKYHLYYNRFNQYTIITFPPEKTIILPPNIFMKCLGSWPCTTLTCMAFPPTSSSNLMALIAEAAFSSWELSFPFKCFENCVLGTIPIWPTECNIPTMG